jgi:hypothetical protein
MTIILKYKELVATAQSSESLIGHGSCRPGDTSSLAERVARCVDLVASWMRSNRLSLNSGKTEVLWVSTTRRQHQLPVSPMLIDGSLVHPARTVRNLGVFIDADLRYENTRDKSCCSVLRRPTSSAANPSTSTIVDTTDVGRGVSPIPAGLRE